MRLIAACIACDALLLASVPFASAAVVPEDAPRPARINVQDGTPVLGDFILGPTRFILPMKPGEERSVDVQITNRMGEDVVFEVGTEDFFADPEQEGTPSFFEAHLDGPYPARLWLTPEYNTFSLKHAERAFIRVTVKVPLNAEPGDHQGAVIIKEIGERSGRSGIDIVPRLASLFIVTVDGDITRDASLVSFSPKKYLNWSLPAFLSLTGTNKGTVHFNASGTVEIRNMFGIMVDELPVKNWIVLRDSTRQRPVEWSPRFALGRYTAVTNITLFDGEPNTQLKTSFWVVPLLPILVILFTVFFVSFAVQYFFSRFEIKKKN